ncbi:MAG TPA: hypothetical protein VKU80_05310 [Planctomycetota bacterium]|nr:hypothetical protein [Planctomycetota bacterium]
MRRGLPVLAAILALALAGCLDQDNEFTLNPDGSGKVRIKCVAAPVSFNLGKEKSPEELLKQNVRETLENSAGVDAWSDVVAGLRDDGKMSFTGTAYFKDIEQLKLKVMGVSSSGPELVVTRGKGTLTVQCIGEKKEPKPAEPPGNMTEDQIKARMKEERAKYQQGKLMMESFLKDVKFHTRVNLPGALGEVHNFKKVGVNSVEIAFEGAKLLKVLETLVMDDAFLRKSILEGRDLTTSGPDDETVIVEKLFGEKAPISASTQGPLKPVFNYEVEAAPARKNLPEILKKYGAASAGTPAAAGATLKSVRVAGVQLVHVADNDRGLRPFNMSEPSFSLSVIAELSGAALTAKEGKITKAVADTGENILPRSDFDRQIHFPRLSDDKKAVVFDVKLALPGPKASGIKEVTGSLQYVVADKTKEVDLGVAEFKKGAKGTEFGVEIEKVEASDFGEGRQNLVIRINLAHEDVESVVFYDDSGKKIETSSAGYSSSGKQSELTFQMKGKFPPKGKIVARVFDQPKTYDAPFTISNIDLLGRPQK